MHSNRDKLRDKKMKCSEGFITSKEIALDDLFWVVIRRSVRRQPVFGQNLTLLNEFVNCNFMTRNMFMFSEKKCRNLISSSSNIFVLQDLRVSGRINEKEILESYSLPLFFYDNYVRQRCFHGIFCKRRVV